MYLLRELEGDYIVNNKGMSVCEYIYFLCKNSSPVALRDCLKTTTMQGWDLLSH